MTKLFFVKLNKALLRRSYAKATVLVFIWPELSVGKPRAEGVNSTE